MFKSEFTWVTQCRHLNKIFAAQKGFQAAKSACFLAVFAAETRWEAPGIVICAVYGKLTDRVNKVYRPIYDSK